MRQYDVYRNPTPRTRKHLPYLVILQADLVSETESVIVAPLTADVVSDGSRLYPEFEVRGQSYTLLTPDLASVPRDALKDRVTSLSAEWSRVTAAIDILFTGI
ncbi:CcdB family protein [Hyphomicrobium sp.]|uniref:CcdB family protein n=1 Tax=Hyphomicrobium sp. TaxID=82 RepID=UPI0025B9EDA2|nr:CcdB family protein [Hyphomicrobium sp.]MCC7252649.1 CcdB family protein [Hyphomicrobium sp.]